MAAMDVVLLCSKTEGMPLVPIEAMAAGRPAVVTDVGGCREAVADGETGYVVPPGEAAPLAEALGRLLGDPALRARMGAAGRARFERLFSLDRMVRAYQAAYLGGPPASLSATAGLVPPCTAGQDRPWQGP
jgi:glycosyltransferase involved in cell wall biosynthesis